MSVVGGAVDDVNPNDWYSVTLATPETITIQVEFNAGGVDPDIDAIIRNDANTATVTGGSAETAANPEMATTAVLAAGTYRIRVLFFDFGDAEGRQWYRWSVNRN